MEALQPNFSYHIFNHANGFENVFREDENYSFFLEKYQVYITPIAETYAYCLLPNHFHLVVRIRKREVLEEIIQNKNKTTSINNFHSNNSFLNNNNFGKVWNFGKVVIAEDEIEKYLSKQFANLFSSYTQSFNKVYKRMGSLFIKNFKREPILDKEYFINSIIYTHRNPIHHGFCTDFTEWGYSSYCEIVEAKSDLVEVEKIIKIFEGKNQFVERHQLNLNKFNQTFDLETP